MGHREFLEALAPLLDSYARLGRAIAAALPPQLAAIGAVDPLTRAALEEFGDPLVRWFGRGSTLRGVRVDDGTLVLDAAPGASGPVLFLAGTSAEHDSELPAGWRERAREVGRVEDERLVLG